MMIKSLLYIIHDTSKLNEYFLVSVGTGAFTLYRLFKYKITFLKIPFTKILAFFSNSLARKKRN